MAELEFKVKQLESAPVTKEDGPGNVHFRDLLAGI